MQRYELEAWLGDDHGLTADQVTELLSLADDIEARYPDPDDQDERDAALTTAYQIMTAEEGALSNLSTSLAQARLAQVRALASIQQAATMLIEPGGKGINSQYGFAQFMGVDRMSVRGWLGMR